MRLFTHLRPGLSLSKRGSQGLCLALVLSASIGARAELSEPLDPEPNPLYFNLFSSQYGTGSNALVGDLDTPTDTVWLCGTENCGPGDEDAGGYGYAEFSIDTTMPAGSGAIDPFLRLQHNDGSEPGKGTTDIEQAFNTNNDDLQEIGDLGANGDPSEIDNFAKDTGAGAGQQNVYDDFNHAIQWETMFIDDEGYMTFLLDINEPGTTCNNGGSQCNITSTLRIDELSFFIATTNDLSHITPDTQDPEHDPTASPNAACTDQWQPGDDPADLDNMCDPTKAQTNFNNDTRIANDGEEVFKFWDMDWDTNYAGLLADNLNDTPGKAGSGDLDVRIRVPVTDEMQAFVDANAGEELFVYLYTFMGEADNLVADGGSVGIEDPDPCTGNGCKSPDTGIADAGFEEFVYLTADGTHEVPAPSTAFLVLAGVLGLFRRKA